MNRSVAIIGPTPSFLRWAIRQPCPLREFVDGNLPAATFRQLRGLRELSVAKIEGRIFEQVGIHPQAKSTDPFAALGFSSTEIVDPLGGMDFVEKCCGDCPANTGALSRPKLMAGCYGMLPVDLNIDFETIGRGNINHDQGIETRKSTPFLIEFVEQAVDELKIENELRKEFLPTAPWWFGLWSEPVLSVDRLELVEAVFKRVLSQLQKKNEPQKPDNQGLVSANYSCLENLIRFVDAVSICHERRLPLHVDLVPAGNSDGRCWTISRHCGICKYPKTEKRIPCPVCGSQGHEQNEIKHRVLGLRPYLHLHLIFGTTQTQDFLIRYEMSKGNS